MHAFVGEAVDIGGFDVGMACTTERIPAEVIAEHDDNIRTISGQGGC